MIAARARTEMLLNRIAERAKAAEDDPKMQEKIADAITETNKENAEAAKKQVEINAKAKQKYNECIDNCEIEKAEAESSDGSCCGGDWYRYLCFCYLGTCCKY